MCNSNIAIMFMVQSKLIKVKNPVGQNYNNICTISIIPALPSRVSTLRLKVTVPMSCRLGSVMLTHSSTCPSPSPTMYIRLSNPTTTAVSTNSTVSYFSSQFHKPHTESIGLYILKVCDIILFVYGSVLL